MVKRKLLVGTKTAQSGLLGTLSSCNGSILLETAGLTSSEIELQRPRELQSLLCLPRLSATPTVPFIFALQASVGPGWSTYKIELFTKKLVVGTSKFLCQVVRISAMPPLGF